VQTYWAEGGTTSHNCGKGPSNDYFIKVWFQLSNWFQNDYRLLGASGLIDAMKYLAFLLSKQIFFVIKQMNYTI
jgi:hypothetical protein